MATPLNCPELFGFKNRVHRSFSHSASALRPRQCASRCAVSLCIARVSRCPVSASVASLLPRATRLRRPLRLLLALGVPVVRCPLPSRDSRLRSGCTFPALLDGSRPRSEAGTTHRPLLRSSPAELSTGPVRRNGLTEIATPTSPWTSFCPGSVRRAR